MNLASLPNVQSISHLSTHKSVDDEPNQLYQQPVAVTLQQQQQQPLQSSQFQITSNVVLSRQQSVSMSANKQESSKESRFRIVKTDSDKKPEATGEQNLFTTVLANLNSNENNNTEESIGSAAANVNASTQSPITAKLQPAGTLIYKRGRWKVTDYDTKDMAIANTVVNNENAINYSMNSINSTPVLKPTIKNLATAENNKTNNGFYLENNEANNVTSVQLNFVAQATFEQSAVTAPALNTNGQFQTPVIAADKQITTPTTANPKQIDNIISSSSNQLRSNSFSSANLLIHTYPAANQKQSIQQQQQQQQQFQINSDKTNNIGQNLNETHLTFANDQAGTNKQHRIIPNSTMTTSLPPSVLMSALNMHQSSSSSTANLDLLGSNEITLAKNNNNAGSTMPKQAVDSETTEFQFDSSSLSLNINIPASLSTNGSNQISPKETNKQQQQQANQFNTNNNISTSAIPSQTNNLATSSNMNGLSTSSTTLDQTAVSINELLGDNSEAENSEHDKKSL